MEPRLTSFRGRVAYGAGVLIRTARFRPLSILKPIVSLTIALARDLQIHCSHPFEGIGRKMLRLHGKPRMSRKSWRSCTRIWRNRLSEGPMVIIHPAVLG